MTSGVSIHEKTEELAGLGFVHYLRSEYGNSARLQRSAWNNHVSDRVGQIQLRVLSGIFTHARNEGAFDDANPIQGARIPSNAREPNETYAYNLAQICRILEFLPMLPKAIIATAAFAGLRRGELRGLDTHHMIRKLAETRVARTVVLKLKTAEFKILPRSHTPSSPPSSFEELTAIALSLRERVSLAPQQRFRVVGVGLSNFLEPEDGPAAQPGLFD